MPNYAIAKLNARDGYEDARISGMTQQAIWPGLNKAVFILHEATEVRKNRPSVRIAHTRSPIPHQIRKTAAANKRAR